MRAAPWLRPGGRLGLQAICLDNAGHQESLSGGGAINDLIRGGDLPGVDVLVALGAGPRLGDRLPPGVLRRRAGALRPHLPGLELGAPRRRRPSRGAGRARGPPALRPLLRRQPRPVPAPAADPLPDRPVAPARTEALGVAAAALPARRRPRRDPATVSDPATSSGTSASAIRGRTTTSRTSSTRLWLGPSMSYSSGLWTESDAVDDGTAEAEKVAFFADRLGAAGGRLLDVGCGWAAQLRPMVEQHGVGEGVGLTLSDAQAAGSTSARCRGPRCEWRAGSTTSRPSGTTRSCPSAPSSTSPGTVRRATPGSAPTAAFFARCFGWLPQGGRLGLETIAHDDAPDTSAPRRAWAARRLRARPLPGVALAPPVRDRARFRAVLPRPRAAGRRPGLRPHHPRLAGSAGRPSGRGRGRRRGDDLPAVQDLPRRVGGPVPLARHHELPGGARAPAVGASVAGGAARQPTAAAVAEGWRAARRSASRASRSRKRSVRWRATSASAESPSSRSSRQ